MTGKRIVLAEWRWFGHHPTFFAYFILALEDVGAEILAICPHPDEARQIVARLRYDRNLEPSREEKTTYLELKTTRRRFETGFLTRVSGIDWMARHLRSIEGLAKQWQNDLGQSVDLVFFACIFDAEFKWFHLTQPFWSLPWSGLYLHSSSIRLPRQQKRLSRPARPEQIFRGTLCKGLATLDEGIAPQLAALTGKPVVIVPDLTDERLPATSGEKGLTDSLSRFAAGRPIIGLFGYLLRSKGVVPLALLSRHPRMAGVCFAFGGEMVWSNYSREEADLIRDVLTNGSNTWNHLMRIPDEEQLNSLLSACDILYAAYLDFPNSSNIVTKAALLRKPLIVSEGYLMAERVRRFQMGEIVPQGDVEAQVEAITKITQDPEAWLSKNDPRWSDYNREHSFQRLKDAFRDFLGNL